MHYKNLKHTWVLDPQDRQDFPLSITISDKCLKKKAGGFVRNVELKPQLVVLSSPNFTVNSSVIFNVHSEHETEPRATRQWSSFIVFFISTGFITF